MIIISLTTFTLIVIIFSVFLIKLVIILIFAICNCLRVIMYNVKFELKLIRELEFLLTKKDVILIKTKRTLLLTNLIVSKQKT